MLSPNFTEINSAVKWSTKLERKLQYLMSPNKHAFIVKFMFLNIFVGSFSWISYPCFVLQELHCSYVIMQPLLMVKILQSKLKKTKKTQWVHFFLVNCNIVVIVNIYSISICNTFQGANYSKCLNPFCGLWYLHLHVLSKIACCLCFSQSYSYTEI